MECEGEEESAEMFSPNESSGEYMPHNDTVKFKNPSAAESTVTEPLYPMDEYIIQLEVMMVDWSGRLHPPGFLWNAGMILHVYKSDLALRELKHVQVDGPSLAYLFFYDS